MSSLAAGRPPQIFDRTRIRRAREKNARRFHDHDYLHRRAMADIVDRLETVTRDFPTSLFYGAGELVDMLTPACGVGWMAHGDLAFARTGRKRPAIILDEECAPFAPQSFDLIVSLLTLHDANDLIGALSQWRRALKPDGLFLAAMFGEDTLVELKSALYAAETELSGGVAPRIPPFAGVKDLGAALQRAGFTLPVVDVDNVAVRYGEPLRLLRDLQGMGETNSLALRSKPLTRKLITRSLQHLAGAGGSVRFDIVFLTAWAPHPDQPKALKPGSAKRSLEEAVKKSAG